MSGKVPLTIVAAQRRNNDTGVAPLLSENITSKLFAGLIDYTAERIFNFVEGLPTKTVNRKCQIFNFSRQAAQIDINDFIITVTFPVRLSPVCCTERHLDVRWRKETVSTGLPAWLNITQLASRSMLSLALPPPDKPPRKLFSFNRIPTQTELDAREGTAFFASEIVWFCLTISSRFLLE